MALSNEGEELDFAYVVAALVEEAGGLLTVSTEWFNPNVNSFEGKRLQLTHVDGMLQITLAEGEEV